MRDSLLLAIDQFESGQAAVDFTIGLAARTRSNVRIFHVRELSRSARVPPLETVADAQILVDHAVLRMQLAGINAQGHTCSAREDWVAKRIVDEAAHQKCSVIVLGSLRLRGIHRISGHGVREHVLQLSSLPVVVAPTALRVGRKALV